MTQIHLGSLVTMDVHIKINGRVENGAWLLAFDVCPSDRG